jgi:hypothetical protein
MLWLVVVVASQTAGDVAVRIVQRNKVGRVCVLT